MKSTKKIDNAKKIDGYVKRIEDKPAKIWSILENVK